MSRHHSTCVYLPKKYKPLAHLICPLLEVDVVGVEVVADVAALARPRPESVELMLKKKGREEKPYVSPGSNAHLSKPLMAVLSMTSCRHKQERLVTQFYPHGNVGGDIA